MFFATQTRQTVRDAVMDAWTKLIQSRQWFHSPGFPAFRGVIFWQDFVQWRAGQNGFKSSSASQHDGETAAAASKLPPLAAQILLDA